MNSTCWASASAKLCVLIVYLATTLLLVHYVYLKFGAKSINFGFGFEALFVLLLDGAAIFIWLVLRMWNRRKDRSWIFMLLGFCYVVGTMAFLNKNI